MRCNLKCGVGKEVDFVRAVVSLGMVYYQQDYHIINLIQFKITSRPNNKEILQILKLLLKVLASEWLILLKYDFGTFWIQNCLK